MKKKMFTLFTVLTCLSLFPTLQAQSQTIENEEQYNIVRGEEEELLCYYHDTQSLRHTVLLRFDLSEVPEGEITNVTLRLYGTAEPGGGIHPTDNRTTPEKHTIAVYNMNHNQKEWNESTFMYNNYEYYYDNPQIADHQIAILSDISGEGWFEWNVTDGVAGCIQAGDRQLTLSLCNTSSMIAPTGEGEKAYMRFHSKENKSGNAPVLSFTTDVTSIRTSATGQYEYHIVGHTLTVNAQHPRTQLLITDLSGRKLYQTNHQEEYKCTFQEKGIYIFSLQEGNQSHTRKICIR